MLGLIRVSGPRETTLGTQNETGTFSQRPRSSKDARGSGTIILPPPPQPTLETKTGSTERREQFSNTIRVLDQALPEASHRQLFLSNATGDSVLFLFHFGLSFLPVAN